MDVKEIINAIIQGEYSREQENAITRALEARKHMRAEELKEALEPGDIVQVHGLRPKYINGQEAEIMEVNRTRAKVRFRNPTKARRFGNGLVNVPLTNMRKVG